MLRWLLERVDRLEILLGAGDYCNRIYKEVDGVVFIRKGNGGFETLEEHLKRVHPKEYEALKMREVGH